MADSSGASQRPPSLKAFLDAGGDLLAAEVVWEERLAEVVYFDLPSIPPGERAKRAADARAKALADARRPCRRGRRGRQDRQLQQQRTLFWHWAADLYEAPELAERVAAALPAEIVDAYEALTDQFRRQHPLVLRMPEEWWNCHNCGRGFDEGQEQAITVTGHEAFSDLQENITYCTSCMTVLVGGTCDGVRQNRGR